jgi:hypothetical protein
MVGWNHAHGDVVRPRPLRPSRTRAHAQQTSGPPEGDPPAASFGWRSVVR